MGDPFRLAPTPAHATDAEISGLFRSLEPTELMCRECCEFVVIGREAEHARVCMGAIPFDPHPGHTYDVEPERSSTIGEVGRARAGAWPDENADGGCAALPAPSLPDRELEGAFARYARAAAALEMRRAAAYDAAHGPTEADYADGDA